MLRFLGKSGILLFTILNAVAVVALLLSYLATWISPGTISWLALFGLAYLPVIAVNILFVIGWAILGRKRALLSLAVILLGFNYLTATVQIFPKFWKASPENQEKIDVMSYNCRMFDWYNWRENTKNRDITFRKLVRENPDIICFQEFFYHRQKGVFDTRDSLTQILDAKNFHEQYSQVVLGTQNFGIATFTRYPIVARGVIAIPRNQNNLCIYTDMVIDSGDTIRVYNAHLASIGFDDEDYKFVETLSESTSQEQQLKGSKKIIGRLLQAFERRAIQTAIITEHIRKSPYPVIVCGDFNDTPVSYTYEQFQDFLIDSFQESGWGFSHTYRGLFPAFRIDYIFHSAEFTGRNYHMLEEEISDHHPITTELYYLPASSR